jgi:hypothetical protein
MIFLLKDIDEGLYSVVDIRLGGRKAEAEIYLQRYTVLNLTSFQKE